MNNVFLHKEYELCFTQLRYYDTRQNDLHRYLFTLTSSAAAALFAMFKIFGQVNQELFLFFAFAGTIIFVSSLLIYLAMLQNRLYFVFTARQINAIRKHLLAEEAGDFKDNQLYTRFDFSAAKPMSLHTLSIVGASFLVSMYAGAVVYSVLHTIGSSSWFIAFSAAGIAFLALSIGGYFYLQWQSVKSADEAIHRTLG